MSVLIRGMKMPYCCDKCGFGRWSNLHQTAACSIYNYDACFEDGSVDYRKKRSEFCPLTEVKEPHGDLVDKDKLMQEFMNSDLDHLQRDDWKEVIQIVSDADVVIEAEGREE